MTEKRSTLARGAAPLVLSAAMAAGCVGPVMALAVWLGKAVLYTAAVKLTVSMVDSVLGNKAKDPEAEFVPDYGNPNQGKYRNLTFQKRDEKGQPVGRAIVLVDVPVYRGADGVFHIESGYLEKVNEAIKKAERE